MPSRPWAIPVRWPTAEKQGTAQLLPLSFPLAFVFPFFFPFFSPFSWLFVSPFAFPCPLVPLALLFAVLVVAVGVLAPLVVALAL